MVLLISPKRIKLESCACAQIEALEEGNRWLYLDDAGYSSERGRNAANLISEYGGLFSLFPLRLRNFQENGTNCMKECVM